MTKERQFEFGKLKGAPVNVSVTVRYRIDNEIEIESFEWTGGSGETYTEPGIKILHKERTSNYSNPVTEFTCSIQTENGDRYIKLVFEEIKRRWELIV